MNDALKLLSVKLAHTLIWAFFTAVIVCVLYCGLANQLTTYTWVAIGLVIAEGLVLLVFGGHSPLTILARTYSDLDQDNFASFLPN